MYRSVEEYLERLGAELAAEDPALRQDALYDAEEYLRAEVAGVEGDPTQALAEAIERYGAPEEVAVAYREAERTVTTALRMPRPERSTNLVGRFFGVLADPLAWGSLFYMLLALATGVTYFTIVVTGISLSLGLAILIIGLPFMLLFLATVRATSLLEGRMVELLLGERMPRRPRVASASDGRVIERIKGWLTDVRTWTTMLYMLLQLPLGTIYFSLVAALLSTSVGLIVWPVAQYATNEPVFVNGDYGYLIQPWAVPILVVGGVLLGIVTMHLVRLIGRGHAAYAKAMLVGRAPENAVATQAVQAPVA